MQGSVEDWKKLLVSANSVSLYMNKYLKCFLVIWFHFQLLTLSHVCGTLPQNIKVFKKLKDIRCSGELVEIVSVIQRLIDFPESARLGRFVINAGVDAPLDKCELTHKLYRKIIVYLSLTIRNKQVKATNEIRVRLFEEIANWEIARLPPFVNKAVIEFLPSAGHCLCIRSWLTGDEEITADSLNIPGLEMKVWQQFLPKKYSPKLINCLVLYQREHLLQKQLVLW